MKEIHHGKLTVHCGIRAHNWQRFTWGLQDECHSLWVYSRCFLSEKIHTFWIIKIEDKLINNSVSGNCSWVDRANKIWYTTFIFLRKEPEVSCCGLSHHRPMAGQESKHKILDLSALKSTLMNLVLVYFKDITSWEIVFDFTP